MRYILWIVVLLFLSCSNGKQPLSADGAENDIPMPNPQPTDIQTPQFRAKMSGRAETADGTPFSFHLYESSEGLSVSTRFETHTSPTSSEKGFARSIKAAVEVIAQGPKFDEHGQQVGERVMLKTKKEESDKTQYTIVGREGTHLHFIESDFLQAALDFEKWYKPRR